MACGQLYLVYGPQSVTPQPYNRDDRRNITFTALYFANNLTVNWSEAHHIRHSCFNENTARQLLQPSIWCLKMQLMNPSTMSAYLEMKKAQIWLIRLLASFFPKHIPTYKHCWASYFQIAIKDKLLVTLILKQFLCYNITVCVEETKFLLH